MTRELRKAYEEVLEENIIGMSEEEAAYWLENDAIPEDGSVCRLIYTSEMRERFSAHIDELRELWKEYRGNTCPPSFSQMVWLGWEVFRLNALSKGL